MKNTTNLLEIVAENERYSPHSNILSALRLLEIGNYLELKPGQTVIDCGCGRGEALYLWAKYFDTVGVGIDIGDDAITSARTLAEHSGVTDKVRFECMNMRAYNIGSKRFDVAACFGATMCFGGFEPAIHALKKMIAPGGQIVIGEAFFTTHEVPDELKEYEGDEPTETELFDMARAAGCEVGYYSRASRAEWERYIFHSHRDGLREFLNMPAGPEREKKINRRWQDMYLRYRQNWQGMAFMTLHPA